MGSIARIEWIAQVNDSKHFFTNTTKQDPRVTRLRSIAFASLLFATQLAGAGMMGTNVEAWMHVPPSPFFGAGGDFAKISFVVSDGVEATTFGVLSEARLDFSDDQIFIDFWRPSGRVLFELGSYEFSFLSPTIEIASVSLGPLTTSFEDLSGSPIQFSSSRISYTATSVSVDLEQLAAPAGSSIQMQLSFVPAPVPEPSQAILMMIGLTAISFATCRRKILA